MLSLVTVNLYTVGFPTRHWDSPPDGVPSLFPFVKINVNTVSKLGCSGGNKIHALTAVLCRLVEVFRTGHCVNNCNLHGVYQQTHCPLPRLCKRWSSVKFSVSFQVMLGFSSVHRFAPRPWPVRITRDYYGSNTTAYQACICHQHH